MSGNGHGSAGLQEIDRHADGVGWIANPDETMQRASHAISLDGEIYVLDPVDAEGVDDLLGSLDGSVAGVVVCLDRHQRDAGAVARRHDVPVFVPTWMDGVEFQGVRRERFDTQVTDGLRTIRVRESRLPPWQEAGLYAEQTGTLYIPESVGTTAYMVTDDERLGVHPMLRLFPPDTLRGLDPDRILVGHGAGIAEDATAALASALRTSRGNTLSLYAKTARSLF